MSGALIFGIALHFLGSVTLTGGQAIVKLGNTLKKREEQEKDREADPPPDPPEKGPDASLSDSVQSLTGTTEQEKDGKETATQECASAPGPPEDPSLTPAPPETFLTRFSSGFVGKFGWGLFVFGAIPRFVAFRFAPQVILSALGSAQFVCLPVWAYFLLGETVGRLEWGGVAVIIAGNAVLLLASAGASTYVPGMRELKEYWIDGPMVGYLLAAAATGALLTFVHLRIKKRMAQCAESAEEAAALAKYCILLPITFSVASALVGTLSVLQAKSLSYILSMPFPGQLTDYYTYLTLAGFIVTNVFWLRKMAQGLAEYKVVLIAPLLQVSWVVISIISGGIYFQEFEAMDVASLLGYVAGVVLILCGAGLLAQGAYHEGAKADTLKKQELDHLVNKCQEAGKEGALDGKVHPDMQRAMSKVRVAMQFDSILSIDRVQMDLRQDLREFKQRVAGNVRAVSGLQRWRRTSHAHSLHERPADKWQHYLWLAFGDLNAPTRSDWYRTHQLQERFREVTKQALQANRQLQAIQEETAPQRSVSASYDNSSIPPDLPAIRGVKSMGSTISEPPV